MFSRSIRAFSTASRSTLHQRCNNVRGKIQSPSATSTSSSKLNTKRNETITGRSVRSMASVAHDFTASELANQQRNANLFRLIEAYRRFGHFSAELDPLGLQKRNAHPELDLNRYGLANHLNDKVLLEGLVTIEGKTEATVQEVINHLQSTYCKKVGPDFYYIVEQQQRQWLAQQLERAATSNLSESERRRIFQLMLEAEVFDLFLQKKFPFVKRYALEGNEVMTATIDAIFERAAQNGVTHVVIGMPHRGRLNFLQGLLGYPAENLLWKVAGKSEVNLKETPFVIGDVLSHLGISTDLTYAGRKLHVSLLQNPSHLEGVNPVAMGKTRAKQTEMGDSNGDKVLCVLFHGDAAMYGQGVVAESFAISRLPNFDVHGTIHIIVNNQLGYTTTPDHGRSSAYSGDIAKLTEVPKLQANAESPADLVKVARIATDFRQQFKRDVLIDIVGYRRHGHNELDEPSFTQPVMYDNIRGRKSIVSLYGDQLKQSGLIDSETIDKMRKEADAKLDQSHGKMSMPQNDHLRDKWSKMQYATDITKAVNTGVDVNQLKEFAMKSIQVPKDMKVHSRLEKMFFQARVQSVEKDKIDWATAESMAFSALLMDGYRIRLCGQDVGRGTFSQRHMILTDQKTNQQYVPLNNLASKQGQLEVINSPLSELAVMAFEYGYSWESPNIFSLWEAQFGDFANSAQVTIDNFLISGESKWLRQSSLTLLLPHGYDGTGPEHSSSRLERFLQLSDADSVDLRAARNKSPNIQIMHPTTPANYFHALRRQMLRPFRKPLIVMSPKTLLRLAQAVSPVSEMASGTSFAPFFTDKSIDPQQVTKVIFCCGKVYYDLVTARSKSAESKTTAIVRIEELVPFPVDAVEAELSKFSNAKDFVWFQEESQNSGAWSFIQPRFITLNRPLRYIGRPPCPASAVGTHELHDLETKAIFGAVFKSA